MDLDIYWVIRMFRNRENLFGMIYIIFVAVCSFGLYRTGMIEGGILFVVDGFLYMGGFFFFSWMQLHKLKILCEFLRKAQYELLPLEIKDQQEGEFGVLKSEIYKQITRFHAQEELLQKEKKYLADTISDISHQLKTPMTSMYVMLDLLKDQELPQEKRLEFIRTLHSQTVRMEWLLSAMLTMSKLDAGTILLKKDIVSVDEMLDRALEHLLIPLELHDQEAIREGQYGTTYTGDLSWSSEAVSNILKNCMEHMKAQGIIRIKTCQNPVYTEIRIMDNGCGISAEDIPHVFERFYRGKHTSKDSVGIGLALADKLISLQNGKIEVDSVYGKSTTFTIQFYHYNI